MNWLVLNILRRNITGNRTMKIVRLYQCLRSVPDRGRTRIGVTNRYRSLPKRLYRLLKRTKKRNRCRVSEVCAIVIHNNIIIVKRVGPKMVISRKTRRTRLPTRPWDRPTRETFACFCTA